MENHGFGPATEEEIVVLDEQGEDEFCPTCGLSWGACASYQEPAPGFPGH